MTKFLSSPHRTNKLFEEPNKQQIDIVTLILKKIASKSKIPQFYLQFYHHYLLSLIIQSFVILFKEKKMQHQISLVLLLVLARVNCSILSSVDFTTNVVIPGTYPRPNTVGLSMYLPDVKDFFNNSLFKGYIWNSAVFNRYSAVFYQSFHVPIGYKYNCSTALYNGASVTCTFDMAANSSFLTTVEKYIYDMTNYYGSDIGWDLQKSNFSNTAYFSNFAKFNNIFYYDSINLELLDYGDKMTALRNQTYNITNYLADLTTISTKYYGLWINGPGITEDADFTWVDQIQNLYNNYYTTFTYRCVLFKNPSEATIPNLLSDYYTKDYLLRRFVDRNGSKLDLTNLYVSINEMKLIEGVGIDGVTNSFAAALWLIDVSFEFSILGGYNIGFYSPFNVSFQSVLGPSPLFPPTSLYYGLLFVCYAFTGSPDFQLPTVIPHSSSNIKIYGISLYNGYRIMIINKDINPNASGTVQIQLTQKQGISCVYLSASNLSSTTNITWANVSFISNNSNYIGSFASYTYYIDPDTGTYLVNLSYAQAAVCETLPSKTYYQFPRGKSTHNFGPFLILSLLILALQFSFV